MVKLIVLGSANAVSDETHENTHLALKGQERFLLIDCVGNPILRLRRASLDFNELTDLILTHFHPDHVSGVPLLLMDMWLLGRKKPLHIYGLQHTLDRIEDLMGFYDWTQWPEFFPVHFHRLAAAEMVPVFESGEMRVFASAVHHLLPTIGIRIEFPQSDQSMAYSCDTEPCSEVARLGSGSTLLIHEASGPFPGHSSASQAGKIALEAGAKTLMLIHYPSDKEDGLLDQARSVFPGQVVLAKDFTEWEF